MILKKMEAIEYRSLSDFVDKTYVLNLEELQNAITIIEEALKIYPGRLV